MTIVVLLVIIEICVIRALVYKIREKIKSKQKPPATVQYMQKPPADRTRENAKSAEKDAARLEREQAQKAILEKRMQREQEKDRIQAERQTQKRQLAENDKDFYISQIDALYRLLWEADADLQSMQDVLDHSKELNKYGAVISEKQIAKQKAAVEKQTKKILTLEKAIHAAEKNLAKTEYTIKAGA